MKTALDTELGPLDLGRPERWVHITPVGSDITYCGADCTGIPRAPLGTKPGRRCPDCARVRGQRFGPK